MTRVISSAMQAQLLAGSLRPALFLEIVFETETVWAWSGLGKFLAPGPANNPSSSFPYGQTFIGVGQMGLVRVIPQVSDVIAQNITLELSGIPAEFVQDTISAVRQNSTARLWIGLLDLSNAAIADPVQVFAGQLDVPSITENAETCSISITCENPLIDLNRAPSRRFTDVDQQILFPGDTGFGQVQVLQDYRIEWPLPVGSPTGLSPYEFLTITPAAPVNLRVGFTVQLTCIATRSDGSTANVTAASAGGIWRSSDERVATVNQNGFVTGVAEGMCSIIKRQNHGNFTQHDVWPFINAATTLIVTS